VIYKDALLGTARQIFAKTRFVAHEETRSTATENTIASGEYGRIWKKPSALASASSAMR
jgi:hypothetical protein